MKRKDSNCVGILSDQGKAATASNLNEYTIIAYRQNCVIDKLNEIRKRAKERPSTLKLIYVQNFAQTQNLIFGSIRFSKDYNFRRVNHCRAKVELSAESVLQRTEESNLIKKFNSYVVPLP